jgi:hypothetical protein
MKWFDMYHLDYTLQACDLDQAYKLIKALDQRNSPVIDDDFECDYDKVSSRLSVVCAYRSRLCVVNQVFTDVADRFHMKPVLVDPPPWMREIDEHLLVYLILHHDQCLVEETLAVLRRDGANDIQYGHATWQENDFALRLEFRTEEECVMFGAGYTRSSATDRGSSPGGEHAAAIYRPPGRSTTLFIIELMQQEALELEQRLRAEEFDPRPASVTHSIYMHVNSCTSGLRAVDQALTDAADCFHMKPVLVDPPPWL